MANPRKFSEKIALHNKKQAEETAAFEAVLREVSATTHGVVNKQICQPLQPQHLGQPSDAVFHGGSLPNVKFSSNKSINLQEALHEMKQTESGRQSLFDRMHRCQPLHEQINTREQFDMKRDCSPYSLSYLSPPPDTSWRRAHSDSAIHSSTLAAPSQQTFSLPLTSSAAPNGIIFDMMPVSPVYQLPAAREAPKVQMIQSVSCCCDVPRNISSNINPYLEQDSGIDTNTGSLPNLSDLHFGVGGFSDDILNATGHHGIGPMRVSGTQGSPGARHRRARTGPKPLFLPMAPNVTHYQGGTSVPASLMQYRGSSVSDCGTPSPSPISPSLSLHSYSPPSPGFFSDVLYVQQQQQQQHCLLQQQFDDISVTPTGSLEGQPNANYYCSVNSQPQHLPYQTPTTATFHFAVSDCTSRVPLMQSSPVAAHGAATSYCNSTLPSSGGGQGQFLAYSMRPSTSADGQLSLNVTRASPTAAATPTLLHTARIPDIILTGADELLFGQQQMPYHCGRDMSFHSASILSSNTDMMSTVDDLLCLDDALGVGLNPLELDELQMLTDANMLTDPDTEDSFRLDQL